MEPTLLYIFLGLTAGTLSGLLGIGGGILLVPAMVYGFGLSQHQAQGTTLALMVPPIGLLGAYRYYIEQRSRPYQIGAAWRDVVTPIRREEHMQ